VGNTDMMVELGYIYVHDDYPEFYDLEKGLALYEKAASKNHAIAWNNLGYHYQNGIGYPQDIKSFKVFQEVRRIRRRAGNAEPWTSLFLWRLCITGL
jgi:TPR repeat protein